jgi:hypothetical protein
MKIVLAMVLGLLLAVAGAAQDSSDPDVPVLKRRPQPNESAPDSAGSGESQGSAPQGQAPDSSQPDTSEPAAPAEAAPNPDRHADVRRRGADAMGFSQQDTSHQFLLTRSGGLIRITVNDPDNTEEAGQIGIHLRQVAAQFARGDFSAPQLTHGTTPPGTAQMRQLRSRITYTAHGIQDGAELIISSQDQKAITAIHQFLQFQIEDHQTGDAAAIRP